MIKMAGMAALALVLLIGNAEAILVAECLDRNYVSSIADYIVEGTVEKVESKLVEKGSGFSGWSVYTHNDLKIEKYVKGNPLSENKVQIVTAGGNAGGMRVLAEDQPIFHEGTKVRAYLQEEHGEFSTVCGERGVEKIDGSFEPDWYMESRYVWKEGMEPVLNLTPLNFDLFYYDIDSGQGGEYMKIDIGDPSRRTIDVNNLTYQTSIFNASFKYRGFGKYSAIGFLGEKYLAAYTNESHIASKPVNLVSRRILSKILVDENKKQLLTASSIKKRQYGEKILLSDGYELLAENVSMTSQTAIISITRNGIKIYHKKVKPGDIVVYEKAVDKVNSMHFYQKESVKFPASLPILAFHVDSIMVEDGKTAGIIDGIFQVSDIYTDIDAEYGLLGITRVNETGITMQNRIKATLTFPESMDSVDIQNEYISRIDLIGNIKLKFAGSRDMRFFIYNEDMPVNTERRGSVYQGSSPVLAWDGLNFPGFLYDINSDRFSEKLEVKNITGRIILIGYLRYDIAGIDSKFEVAGFKGSELHGLNASFMIFGIGTEKYIAVNGNSTELLKIILENCGSQYNKKTIGVGEVWELPQGYNLTVKELEVRSDPRKALFSLSHNGTVLKEDWVTAGNFFSYYENESSGKKKIPKFFTYLDTVFVGCCFDIAQVRYAFLTSDNILRIHKGDRIGVMRVIDVEPDLISMENDQDINLKPGSELNLIGNLSFKVADSKDLRFYPVNTKGDEIGKYVEEEINESVKGETKEEKKSKTGIIESSNLTPKKSAIITERKNTIPVVKWSRTFGGENDDRATGAWQTSDGGFIVTGTTRSYDHGINDAWIMKIDTDGDEQWTRTLTGKGDVMFSSFSQEQDRGYLISGFTGSNGSDNIAWFMKLDMNGIQLWNRTMKGPDVTGANFIRQTNDGSFIAAGWNDTYSDGRRAGWLLKTDFEGIEEWNRTYIVKEENTAANYVIQLPDGSFALFGTTESYTSDNYAWMIKTDAKGIKEFEKTFGGPYDDRATSGQMAKDGYIIAGVTRNHILHRFSPSNAWIVKTDPEGNEQWNMTLKESLFSNVVDSIQATDDGGYILSGSTGTYGMKGYDTWVIKLGSEELEKETPGFQALGGMIILLIFYNRFIKRSHQTRKSSFKSNFQP